MSKILIISPRAPYPPRFDGITIRMNPIFEYLSSKYIVDLLIVCDPRIQSNQWSRKAEAVCREVYNFSYENDNFLVRGARSVLGLISNFRPPYQGMRHWSQPLSKTVENLVNNYNYDVILWVGLPDELSVYLSRNKLNTNKPRIVFDWVDSPSLTYNRNNIDSSNIISHLYHKNILKNWKNFESKINREVDSAIYITMTDALYANENVSSKINIIPNGIFDDFPETLNTRALNNQAVTLAFLGNMGYEPNIKAALRLHSIFLKLLPKFPDIRLKIIGRTPSNEIQSLEGDNVEITGTVDSIWPHIIESDILVFPMVTGAGLQNKVLEALRANKPVVTSSICASGLGFDARDAVLIADTDEDFYCTITDLISSSGMIEKYQKKAAEFIKNYDWGTILPKYESILIDPEGVDTLRQPQKWASKIGQRD